MPLHPQGQQTHQEFKRSMFGTLPTCNQVSANTCHLGTYSSSRPLALAAAAAMAGWAACLLMFAFALPPVHEAGLVGGCLWWRLGGLGLAAGVPALLAGALPRIPVLLVACHCCFVLAAMLAWAAGLLALAGLDCPMPKQMGWREVFVHDNLVLPGLQGSRGLGCLALAMLAAQEWEQESGVLDLAKLALAALLPWLEAALGVLDSGCNLEGLGYCIAAKCLQSCLAVAVPWVLGGMAGLLLALADCYVAAASHWLLAPASPDCLAVAVVL